MSYSWRQAATVLLAVFAISGVAHAQAGVAVGYVLDVSGQVVLASGGNRQRAEIFDRIDFNHTLTVPTGGKAVFLYRPERAEYTFHGPAAVQFSSGSVVVKAGNAGVVRSLPAGINLRLEPNSRTRPEMRAAASGEISPGPGETVLTNRPTLSWPPGAPKLPYELTITDCGNDLTTCDGTPARVALRTAAWRPSDDDALEWGHIYRWSVSQGKKTRSDQRGWFIVIAPEQLDLLTALHPGESQEVSQFVLYAQALEEVGARAEAREIWRQLTANRPEQRGFLCKAAGRPVEQCRRIGE